MKTYKFCGLLIGSLMLSGCMASNPKTVSETGISNTPPANWREVARKSARKSLFDPYSARDVEIAAPIPANQVYDGVTPIPHKGWMVCLRANAKNRFGAYTGLQLTGFLIEDDGEIGTVVTIPNVAAYHCTGAGKFEPITL